MKRKARICVPTLYDSGQSSNGEVFTLGDFAKPQAGFNKEVVTGRLQ